MRNIKKSIIESIETNLRIATDENFLLELARVGSKIITALKLGRKVLIAGNGGSAADAQHFAAELAGKFVHKRKGLPAIALTTNSSIITAIGNDFGYEHTFSRQVEGLGRPGDVFTGISTSGNSQNLIEAMKRANSMDIATIGILGNNGGGMGELCNFRLIVPSSNTQKIQEAHILIIHELCAIIDNAFKNHV